MKQTNGKNHSVDQGDPVYHDTYQLLKSYRDTMQNLELEVRHVEREFEIEYENSIDGFLESIYLAGADLNGNKLENYARSIERSNQVLSLLSPAVETLRNKHKFGEQYYWILYCTYLFPQQFQNTDEVINKLRPHIASISYRTYYRRRPQATEALSGILWGYAARSCFHVVDQFFLDS